MIMNLVCLNLGFSYNGYLSAAATGYSKRAQQLFYEKLSYHFSLWRNEHQWNQENKQPGKKTLNIFKQCSDDSDIS